MTRHFSIRTLSRIHEGAIRFGWSESDLVKLRLWLASLGYATERHGAAGNMDADQGSHGGRRNP